MNILLIGAGRSGVGVARLLSKESMQLTLVNENIFPEFDELVSLGIKVLIQDFSILKTNEYDLVIKAPGVIGFPESVNEIEIASRIAKNYKLYAISGTNGKTTTTKLFHSMLLKDDDKALAAGNIGYSLSQAVYDHGLEARNVALEVSTFQIDGLNETKFEVYGLLNLSPDHLDRYSNVEEYYAAKFKMLYHSKQRLINIDDPIIMSLIEPELDYLSLSLNKTADVFIKTDNIYFKDSLLFNKKDLKMPGTHNLMNAMFAATMAYLAGVTPKKIREALHEFKGVAHRLEYIKEIKGVHYYNDSKATNPEATEVCLKSFDGNIQLIAGGFDKKVRFDLLGQYKNKISNIYVYGESANLLKEVFPNAQVYPTMLAASKAAHLAAKQGDTVVLSPACASYDQFKSFEERGNVFKEYIKTL